MKNINGLNVLEKRDFERFCPSFYAVQPKSDVSDRYSFINTREDIAIPLWNAGWYPVYAREQRSNKPENRGKTRHVIRWANKDMVTRVGEERIELVGVNSHNRSSAFQFYAGVFRLVCTNGMIVQSANYGSFKVKHMGDIQEQVQAAITGIAENANLISDNIETMKAIELTPNEQGIFARAAHSYVYDEPEKAPISADRLLYARRGADQKPNLWNTFNRVQENIIKGGIRGYNRDNRRRVTTRHITSIDKDVKINRALWQLADEMKNLKLAA